jgi:hypothetical protein
MKSINTKLTLAALAIAMLATPALAQRQHHQVQPQSQYTPSNDVPHYPNPVLRSGSEASVQSGAEFDESR